MKKLYFTLDFGNAAADPESYKSICRLVNIIIIFLAKRGMDSARGKTQDWWRRERYR